MARNDGSTAGRSAIDRIGYRTIAAIAVGVVVVAFIALNRDETRISFIVFERETALWVALTLAAACGFLAGFLVGRRRYRP